MKLTKYFHIDLIVYHNYTHIKLVHSNKQLLWKGAVDLGHEIWNVIKQLDLRLNIVTSWHHHTLCHPLNKYTEHVRMRMSGKTYPGV